MRFLHELEELVDYKKLPKPIEFKGFKAVGYFEYERAQINNQVVAVSREVYEPIEYALRFIMDNKIVVVFEDTTRFDTQHFAIQFKDAYARIGRIRDICGYAGKELKHKEQLITK